MPEAASLAASFPGVQIIVDHIGMPVYRGESGWDSWRTGIDVIAGRPNVSIKLSGFGMFDVSWTAESIRPGVELVLERFGPDRCMFGSNFPVDKRWATFAEAFDRVSTAVGALSEVERDAVFAGNAIRFYRLEP
jgi:predicted TIM-barrel fold metal-dependent hydrolase